MRRLPVLVLALSSCEAFTGPDFGTPGRMPEEDVGVEDRKYESLAEAFLAWHYSQNPARATRDGIHEYDDVLGSASREDIEGRVESLYYHLKELWRIDRGRLDPENAADAAVLEGHIQAELLDLEQIRWWERDPGWYNDLVSSGLYTVTAYSFESLDRRMKHATRRLRGVPAVLQQARENLVTPPRIYTEMAVDGFGGTHKFIKQEMVRAFAPCVEPALRAYALRGPRGMVAERPRAAAWTAFTQARAAALKAIEEFVDWMRKELLPKSTGSYALGAHDLSQLLAFRELERTPPAELLQRATAWLRAAQRDFETVAKRIRPEGSAASVLRTLSTDRPTAEQLLPWTEETLEAARRWALTMVDFPADARCRVQETPPFRRSTSFASMELPGPFENVATEAYYSVTPPDPEWTDAQRDQHLAFYNKFSLPIITVHEAYPGHFVQFLLSRAAKGRARKVFRSAAFSEGWAHYCEQLFVEGSTDDPLRLHQLAMAILRYCRFVVSIEMHCNGMTYEQAVDFFMNEGSLERVNAEREARRATRDPLLLAYSFGKHEFLKLRDAEKARLGEAFDLRAFHTRLLSHGSPPFAALRMLLRRPN